MWRGAHTTLWLYVRCRSLTGINALLIYLSCCKPSNSKVRLLYWFKYISAALVSETNPTSFPPDYYHQPIPTSLDPSTESQPATSSEGINDRSVVFQNALLPDNIPVLDQAPGGNPNGAPLTSQNISMDDNTE
jgi:hypothetical protein